MTENPELPFASPDGITTLLDPLPIMDFSHRTPYAPKKVPQGFREQGFGSKEVSWLPEAGPFA